MAKIKETLSTKFKMKDMKELHYCLGITIVHDRVKQKVWLNQYQYRTLNPGNLNCQGKLKLLRVIGVSSYRGFEQKDQKNLIKVVLCLYMFYCKISSNARAQT